MNTRIKNCPYAKRLRYEAKMQMIAVSLFFAVAILLTIFKM